MFHSLLAYFAPAQLPAQATTHEPPAAAESRRTRVQRSFVDGLILVAGIVGNAIGFLGLLGGCWMFLEVIRTLLAP